MFSDVDIAYQSKQPLSLEDRANLIRSLKKILNITDADIDLVDMNTAKQ